MAEITLGDVAIWYNTCCACGKEHRAQEMISAKGFPICRDCAGKLREVKEKNKSHAT